MKQKPLIFALAALAATGSSAFAADSQWVPAQSGPQNWNATANWTGTGAVVPDTSTEQALFGNTTPASKRLLDSSTYTINQDVSSLTLSGLKVDLNGANSAFTAGTGLSGTSTITVATPANFRVGDSISGSNLPSGTTVLSISGSDLTLSNSFTSNATGNYTPSNYGTTVNISGNDITLGAATTNNFILNLGNAGATNVINVSTNVVLSTGTTTVAFVQGATAAAGGVNFIGALSGSGNVTHTAGVTLNNASNSQSGTWTVASIGTLNAASNSLGTAIYKITSGSNSRFHFSDSGNFTVNNRIQDTGAWSTVGQSGGLGVAGGATGTFSNFEVGGTSGNASLTLLRNSGSGTGTFKITDTDWTANANLRLDNANLDLANTSGVQTIGAALRDTGSAATLTRSGVGGTTILKGASNLATTVTISGGTLLVNNPTTNVTALTVDSTTGSRTITTASTSGLVVGQSLTGGTLGGGLFITSIVDSTTFTVSANVTTGQTGLAATLSNNSGTGTSSVNVTGGTLGGSGIIVPGGGKNITVSSGAISPGGDASGNTVAELELNLSATTSDATFSTGSTFSMEIGTAGNNDKVKLTGLADASNAVFNSNVVNFTGVGTVAIGTPYTLFTFDAANNTAGDNYTGTLELGTLPAGATGAAFAYNDTSITVTFTGGSTTYASWLATKFTAPELLDPAVSGPSADPDADGMGNLLEFVVGTEPKTAEQGKGPVYTTPSGIPTITLVAKTSSLAEATLTGKSGIDLINWPDSMTLDSSTADTPTSGFTTLIYKGTVSGTKRFYRLEIVSPTP